MNLQSQIVIINLIRKRSVAAMMTYDDVKNNKKLFKTLTSLTPEAFEMLLPSFETAYDTYVAQIIE